jgi:hypothetical protein
VGNEFLNRSGTQKFASGGAGYLLSRAAVELLTRQQELPRTGPEDVTLTRFLLRQGLSWRSTRRLCWNEKRPPGRGNDVVSCHWVGPDKMRAIHVSLTQQPVGEIEVVHSLWHDRLLQYAEGLCGRSSVPDFGRYERFEENLLFIYWFDWKPEFFRITQGHARLVQPVPKQKKHALIRGLAKSYEVKVFIETGTYRGETCRCCAE